MAAFDPSQTLTFSASHGRALLCAQHEDESRMAYEWPDDFTEEERVLFTCRHLASDLAEKCRELKDMKVSSSDHALHGSLNDVMSAMWDQGFTQTEIRGAFLAALADMDRYAAGQEGRYEP